MVEPAGAVCGQPEAVYAVRPLSTRRPPLCRARCPLLRRSWPAASDALGLPLPPLLACRFPRPYSPSCPPPGKGLGKGIINFLTDVARRSGCYKVILDCDESNTGFYRKCGYSGGHSPVYMAVYF